MFKRVRASINVQKPFDPSKVFRPMVSRLVSKTILMFVPAQAGTRGPLFVDALNESGFTGNTVEVKPLDILTTSSVIFGRAPIDMLVFSIPKGYPNIEALIRTTSDFKSCFPGKSVVFYLESGEDKTRFEKLRSDNVFIVAARENSVFDLLSVLNNVAILSRLPVYNRSQLQ